MKLHALASNSQILVDESCFQQAGFEEQEKDILAKLVQDYVNAGLYDSQNPSLTLLESREPAAVSLPGKVVHLTVGGRHFHLMRHLAIKAGWDMNGTAQDFAQEAIGVEAVGWQQGIHIRRVNGYQYLVKLEPRE